MARDLARSPFPGMDPYLEQYWGDVHHRLCTYSCDLLRQVLPSGLISRIDERTVIEFGFDEKRTIIPDVRIVDYGGSHGGVAAIASPVDEPIIVDNELALTEGFVQVIDTRSNNRVVTVIEFASPVNKLSSPGRDKYKKKRQELLDGGVSVVEIDLIRTGEWNLMAPQYEIQSRRLGIYHACLTRGWKAHRTEVYSQGDCICRANALS